MQPAEDRYWAAEQALTRLAPTAQAQEALLHFMLKESALQMQTLHGVTVPAQWPPHGAVHQVVKFNAACAPDPAHSCCIHTVLWSVATHRQLIDPAFQHKSLSGRDNRSFASVMHLLDAILKCKQDGMPLMYVTAGAEDEQSQATAMWWLQQRVRTLRQLERLHTHQALSNG